MAVTVQVLNDHVMHHTEFETSYINRYATLVATTSDTFTYFTSLISPVMTTTLPSNLVLFSDPFIGAMVNSYLQSPLALEMEEHFTSLTWPKSREGASEEGETGKQVDWACSCRSWRRGLWRRWKWQLPPPQAWRGRACEAGGRWRTETRGAAAARHSPTDGRI